jgi:taurine dioxygenase
VKSTAAVKMMMNIGNIVTFGVILVSTYLCCVEAVYRRSWESVIADQSKFATNFKLFVVADTVPFIDIDANEGHKFVLEIVGGLDLATQNDAPTLHMLKQQLMKYGVVILRNQTTSMPVSTFRNIGLSFGDLQIHRENYSWHQDYSDVNFVSNMRDATTNTPLGLNGNDVEQFHSDLAWSWTPTTFTMLMGLVLPPGQGRTLFSDSVAAFESLEQDIQTQILGLEGEFSYWKHHPKNSSVSSSDKLDAVVHPLISVHPVTGARSIYASAADTTFVLGLSESDSTDLLDVLTSQVAQERFRYEHDWKEGDIVMWDNRSKSTVLPYRWSSYLAVCSLQLRSTNPEAVLIFCLAN